MRHCLTIIAFLPLTTIISSCKKDNSITDCFPNSSTVRQISNEEAMVKAGDGKFYLVEQNTIDTKLNPCTLAEEFQVDNLRVIISGDVKSTQRVAFEPCCTDNFVITKISR